MTQLLLQDFLHNDVMALEPMAGQPLLDFMRHLDQILLRLESIFDHSYRGTFGLNNVKCFARDKRSELVELGKKCPALATMACVDIVFVSGGICVGKTTLIEKLILDEEINRGGARCHSIVEPTEYWYKNEHRQFDDALVSFVVKAGGGDDLDRFPFSEFFISTWLLNIMVNLVVASLEKKSLVFIERDFSDEYLLQRRPVEQFSDSFRCFECLKRKLGSYVLLRIVTKGPLIRVMEMNLPLRRTSELAVLQDRDYLEFIEQYETSYKAIRNHISLPVLASISELGSVVACHKAFVREYLIDRFISEAFDEIKLLILTVVKT